MRSLLPLQYSEQGLFQPQSMSQSSIQLLVHAVLHAAPVHAARFSAAHAACFKEESRGRSGEGGRVDPTSHLDRLHGSESLDKLTRLSAHCEPLFAQLKSINKRYLRLKRIFLVTQNRDGGYRHGALITHIRARSGHLAAEIGIKGEHLFAETEIKATVT